MWKCQKCETINDDSTDICVVCNTGRRKTNTKFVYKEPSPSVKIIPETKPKANDNSWKCWKCETLNSGSTKNCIVCGAPRGGFTPPPVKTWKCSECGAINYETSSICSECKRPRYKTVSKPDVAKYPLPQSKKTWTCSKCGTVNDESVTNCIKCSTNRYEVKPAAIASKKNKLSLLEKILIGVAIAFAVAIAVLIIIAIV